MSIAVRVEETARVDVALGMAKAAGKARAAVAGAAVAGAAETTVESLK